MPETKRLLKVFLCHASQDKPVVRELAQRLFAEGWIDPWLDEKKLLPGQDWRSKIEEAVETSDIVIICLSSNSVSKEGFVQKELRYAKEIADEKPEEIIFLIPLRLDDCDPPRALSLYHYGDYFGEKKDETYAALLRSLESSYQQKLRLEEQVYARQEKESLERGAAEKVAQEKVERAKAAREKQEREAADRSGRGKADHETARKIKDTLDVLILIGRPASGKSEIIDFLSHLPYSIRRERFHIARLEVLDDFPILWGWFEEDDILSRKFGLPRLHSDEQGYFKFREFWHVLIERLNLDYAKKFRDDVSYHEYTTALIEFSRGSEHGGYTEAFQHVSEEILKRAALVYVRVPFEESLRKNRRRFNPDRPDSILEHGLSNEKMERLYRADDWTVIAPGESGYLSVRGQSVPYAVFPNEDDVTTGKPEQLAARLESVLSTLWELYCRK